MIKDIDIRTEYKALAKGLFSWYNFDPQALVLDLNPTEDKQEPEYDKYDYIIAYHLFDNCENETETLKKWMNYLKDDGRLLLVVENRFGLKYFCGARDPYTGVCYDGINNYLKGASKDGRCYSRKDIENIFESCGVDKYKFYYPVPDSRMPQMIFTDNYKNGINVFERLVDYNYMDEAMVGIEHRIFSEMIDSGCLPFMANSFVIEIAKNTELSDINYAVITADRGKEAGFATTICGAIGDEKNWIVNKRPLYEQGEANLTKLNENMNWLKKCDVPVLKTTLCRDKYGLCLSMPYCQDVGLTSLLKKLVVTDKAKFLDVFDKIYNYIHKASGKVVAEGSEDVILEKGYIDLAPCNAFYNYEKGDITFYDQEFVMENVPARFAMYRTLKYCYASARMMEDEIPLAEMYDRYGITDKKIEEYEIIEKQFIEGLRHTDDYKQIFEWATPDYDKIYHRMKVISNLKLESEKPYRIGYVPGVYDLFHTGHLRLFERCKERCDYLIVGVLTDELVEYYKNKRPIISYENRAAVIKGLKVVDEVIPVDFSNTDKLDAWEQLHYDCHFSGDDHVGHWNDIIEELRKRGSNMEFFSYTEGISSTAIRKSMQE